MDDRQAGAITQVGPSMAPKLEVTQGENAGETFKVKLNTRIGRERDNDVVIIDPKVSRYHAEIGLEDGKWVLSDLGSSNHTYLNGMVVTEPIILHSGDRISLGSTELTLRLPGMPVDDTAARPAVTPASAAAAPVARRPLPRLVWIASAFILLLCLATAAVLFFAGRTPGGDETAAGDNAPVVGSGGEQQPEEAAAVPANLSLAYEDDFGDSTSGWDDTSDAYTLKRYGNNRYMIEISTSNLVAWGLANRDVADFEIEVEAKLEDGSTDNSYGLLFRFQDRENFYRFDISGDGYYLLSKFVGGEWTTLIDWTQSEHINQNDAANTLKVAVFGHKISLWVNDNFLASMEDESLTHGNFGFFASTFGEPYIWTSYDNLRLWVPSGQEEAITLLPTATRPVVESTPTAFLPVSPLATPTLPEATPVAAVVTPEQDSPTSTAESETSVEEDEETSTPEPTSTSPAASSPLATPIPEETATPVPLPEYASRDQTLARGEAPVTGRIVFPVFNSERGTYDIYIADAADGENRELVQANASQPALNDDGALLAYRSWQPDQRGLFTRPLNGKEAWNFNPFFESARPQFSPIDDSLMFHSRVGGKEPAVYRVINGVSEVMRREGFPIQGLAAKWLPDGQQFVYSSCLGGKCGIILSNIDGANPRLLTDHPSDTNPEVSPDGSSVIFMSKRGGNWEIYRVDINGNNLEALTSDPASDGLPTWSPEGDKIAFVSNRDGEWSVWDADPDGSDQRRLFALGGPIEGQVQSDRANSLGWTEENIDWIP